jgi:hypothetical protein
MGAAFTVSIGDGKINLVNTGTIGYYMQVLPRDLSGEVVTLVAKTSEGIVSKSCIVSDEDSTERIGSLGANIFVSSQGDTTNCGIYFDTYSAVSLDLYWIALYIGEYEAAALPDYIPKSHSEEFLECSRYATSIGRYQTLPSFVTSSQKEVWATVFLPVAMVSAAPVAETLPKVVIRHPEGYSLLTPDSTSSITPAQTSCSAENVQNSNIMRIRMYFDSALGMNNVPASVFIDKGFLISADL